MNRIMLSFSSYSIEHQRINPAADRCAVADDRKYMLMMKKLNEPEKNFKLVNSTVDMFRVGFDGFPLWSKDVFG